MLVKVIDIDQVTGAETPRCECELRDCFPDADDDIDFILTEGTLKREGRCWIGGGAAPLVLLMRVQAN